MEEPQPITADEVKRRMDRGERIQFLDSRSEKAWSKADLQIAGSRRVPPGDVGHHLGEIRKDSLIVPYCT